MEAMNDTIEIDDEDSCESFVSISDNSDEDPSYTAVEETRRKLSNLSVRKKSNPSVVEESDDGIVVDDGEVEEVDEKSYEEVQRIVAAGKTEELKVEQCKVYLRKNGLRLTGNKATLIQRIGEHLEISNGGGEKKYPVSSFFMNCKGDACTGDVVLFKQNVYDTYSIASRSATGPPCGTRMVAGRIVKESYGAAKQQHTFTVEVLWSKGEKALPLLHPLLIKGRNLYRLETMRQRWDDEEDRRIMLNEKHARGSLARSSREARIVDQEKRKGLKENRASKREPRKNQPEPDLTKVLKPSVQPQRPVISDHSRRTETQMIGPGILVKPAFMGHHIPSSTNIQAQNPFGDHRKVTGETQPEKSPVLDMHIGPEASQLFTGRSMSFNNREPRFYPGIQEVQHTRNQPHFNPGGYMDWPTRSNYQPFTGLNTNGLVSPLRRVYGMNNHREPISPPRREYGVNNYHRPISPPRRHYSRPMSPPRRENFVPRKPCHHYARGRCHYGDTCKFSHTMRE